MEEELEVILRAVDEASDTFESVTEAAENMGETVQGGAEAGSEGLDEMEESAEGAVDPLENISNIIGGFVGVEVFSQLADTLWDFADKAGTFEDSLMRARLEAEGAGISVNEMTDTVSELTRITGRAGGEIRESFIKATARGITDMDSFKQMMVGAGAQATLLGTDIQSMGDKFSSMAMRSTLMERQLASTGITMEELADAMGMTGATADEVKAKWQELDTNQRAAALGMAASMNEGQTANEEYKKSWAGLQAQLDIARGRLERLAGEVLLPVLVPALQAAGRMLNWVGDVVSALMKGPLGGLISIVGSVAAGFALVVPALMAVKGAMALYTASLAPAITATWALLAPWLPFIAIGAAIVAIIYEIGKAFGWWTDVSSMMDAIWAGIQRLWSAFINHPDVQGFIQGVSAAWNAMQPFLNTTISLILRFFNVSGKKDFDIVRTLINAISTAWRSMTAPIRLVISVIQAVWRAFETMYNRAKNAIDKTKTVIRSIIHVDISAVTGRLVKPFQDAYIRIAREVDKIKAKANQAGQAGLGILGGAYGFDYEGMLEAQRAGNTSRDINLKVDLANVPAGVDTQTLIAVLTDPAVLRALTGNSEFQSLDAVAKNRLALKNSRARGV